MPFRHIAAEGCGIGQHSIAQNRRFNSITLGLKFRAGGPSLDVYGVAGWVGDGVRGADLRFVARIRLYCALQGGQSSSDGLGAGASSRTVARRKGSSRPIQRPQLRAQAKSVVARVLRAKSPVVLDAIGVEA